MIPFFFGSMHVPVSLLNQTLKLNKNLWLNKSSVSVAQLAKREEYLSHWLPQHIPSYIKVAKLSFEGVAVDCLVPKRASKTRAIIYLHGGGFVAGSPDTTHRDYLWRIAEVSKVRVWAVNYRKTPDHPYPAALDDVYAVYQKLLVSHKPENIAVVGDSSGGGLALALMLRLKGEGLEFPGALSLLSPWADLTCKAKSIVTNADTEVLVPEHFLEGLAGYYAGDESLKNPFVSPLFGDFKGFPPTQILVSTDEVLLDDSVSLAKKMRAAGVDVELIQGKGMPHVWPVFARMISEGREAIRQIGAFIEKHLAK